MHLNGWQRIYVVLVTLWLAYWAHAAYTDNVVLNKRIAELQAAVERYPQQPEQGSGSAVTNVITQTLQGKDVKNLRPYYQELLLQAQQEKTATNLIALFLSVLPPLVVYLILAWIIAGFRRQNPKVSEG